MDPKKHSPFQPFFYALVLALGVFLGYKINQSSNLGMLIPGMKNSGSGKVNQVLNYIEQEYVDTISKARLTDEAITSLLQNLDPHSAYIPASEVQAMNEPMQGNFEGIGIEFNILNDTIIVVAALAGGPSEALGIKAGDRIVKIEAENVGGIKIKNNDVLKRLRGEGGTKVKISIKRRGIAKLMDYTITRGKIPIYSVDAAYMLNNTTGYIKVSRFAATTYDEFLKASDDLLDKGMLSLVLDLRGNPGGYLNTAISICDEFLSSGKKIVYTKGKSHPREDYTATSSGSLEKIKLAVLIDEGSASASEIVSGAIQDNDRGTIIGRRSFGKGLVQQQSDFQDGSALRLTIARYYTPTGRCIQKPYVKGDPEDYYNEEYTRYKHGELVNADSIHFADSLKFITPMGKVVYGGGGIMPDIFVPLDTSVRSRFLTDLIVKGTIGQFAISYSDDERSKLKTYSSYSDFNARFQVNEAMFNRFLKYAEKDSIKTATARDLLVSRKIINEQLKALIARNMWRNEGYYSVMNANDKSIEVALKEVGK
ncbi:MAG: S41 family peptidase [Bacteroidetes bacterium]|nr:S41 family peptidase [Bacteroidota bacterium]